MLLLNDPRACGMGEGERCCAFLVAGAAGFACGRTDGGVAAAVVARLAEGTMNAKYDPGSEEELPYPECQEKRP